MRAASPRERLQALLDESVQNEIPNPLQQVLGKTTEALGIDRLLAALSGDPRVTQSILPVGSALRSPAVRASVHESLRTSARKFAPHIREALDKQIQRHPRLMAHVTHVSSRLPSPTAVGGFLPTVGPLSDPRGALHLNPRIAPDAVERTLQHESTHAAQMLRLADRARHGGVKTTNPFMDVYNKLSESHGYWQHPMEVAARFNEEFRVLRQSGVPVGEARRLAAEATMDHEAFLARMNQSLTPR